MNPAALDLAREVRAMGWYLGHPAVQVGAGVCGACDPPVIRADSADLLRALNRDAGARGKRPPRQSYPMALEARYRGQLLRRQRATHRLLLDTLRDAVAPLRPEINARAQARDRRDAADLVLLAGSTDQADLQLADALVDLRLDSQATDTRALLRVIDRVQAAVKRGSPVQQELLFTLAQQVRSYVTRSVTTQVLTVVGIDVLPTLGTASHLLGKWAADNAALIKSLDARYFDDIRDAVVATVGDGHSTRALSRAIAERYGVARSRADLIATDQVGKLNGQVTQERQTALGIAEYTWDNSGDIRVRPMHRNPGDADAAPGALGGTLRRWDQPHPTEGHPGYPVRCRCSALPVIPK